MSCDRLLFRTLASMHGENTDPLDVYIVYNLGSYVCCYNFVFKELTHVRILLMLNKNTWGVWGQSEATLQTGRHNQKV